MFGKGLRLFKLFGFEVRIDASWLLLAVLIVFSLTSGYFPFHYEDLGSGTYVLMGIVGALGLFASIIIHELCHSLVARRFGMPMNGITLFMFGGVAQMEEESQTPKGEFWMAIAGPIASFALAGVFYLLHAMADAVAVPLPVAGVLAYLAWINIIVAFFNLLPAFPLDGGRILRSGLWAWKKNLRWATRIASALGSGFGIALIVFGILSLFGGHIVGGLWWCLIGMFLRGIAHGSYQQVLIRQTLSGEPVRRFMREKPISVRSDTSVEDLVENYIYAHHFKMFPVIEDDQLVGCVTTKEVKQVPREQWPQKTVAQIATACSSTNTIGPEADASHALARMNQGNYSRLMVVDGQQLLGIVALKDMLRFLTLKLDLEGEEVETEHLPRIMQS